MTQKISERITVNPKQCGGRPCVRGMRIRVTDVLDLYAAGLDSAQIIEEMPDLELEDLQACLQYASRKLNHAVLIAAWRFGLTRWLSPTIAVWIESNFNVRVFALRDLGLCDAEDEEIFLEAQKADAIVMTKDSDFVSVLDRFGSPPKIIWLTCGNTSN